MDDNSFFRAPAGWYPDPLGLPQLRWWDSTAWTHQVAEARQPMVVQETTFAWPDDESDDTLTRRERRERDRQDTPPAARPTAQTLLQLEPPSRADLQTDVPSPGEPAMPGPMAASHAASLQDAEHDPSRATGFDRPTVDGDEFSPIFDRLRTGDAAGYAAAAETPAARSAAPQPQAQPWSAADEPPAAPEVQVVQAPRLHRSVHTGAVWSIALLPLMQLVISLLLITAFNVGSNPVIMALVWLLPYPIVIALAWADHRSLKKAGVTHSAHWAWAFLTAPIYLVMRAIASIRESGGGFGPILVFFGMSLLMLGSVVAVPGLAIATAPEVFSAQAAESIKANASIIGARLEVTCPTTPPVLIGQSFECTGVRASGEELNIMVSLQRINGWIAWRVDDWGIYTIG